MANPTEQSKQYAKTLENNLKVPHQDIFNLLQGLKQSINANRLTTRHKTPKNREKYSVIEKCTDHGKTMCVHYNHPKNTPKARFKGR